MPDISMCPSETCAVREMCKRNLASGTKSSGKRQSWMRFSPQLGTFCSGYWPVADVMLAERGKGEK